MQAVVSYRSFNVHRKNKQKASYRTDFNLHSAIC